MTWRTLNAELVKRAHQLLASASVVAEAPTANPDQAKIHTAPGSTTPTGDSQGLFHRIVRQLAIVRDDATLRDVVHRGETELDAYRRNGNARPVETSDERDARIVVEYEGLLPVEAARLEKVSAENIRRVRFQAGREPRTGHARRVQWKTVNERRVLAIQLVAAGRSLRLVAEDLRVSHTTVMRDLSVEDDAYGDRLDAETFARVDQQYRNLMNEEQASA